MLYDRQVYIDRISIWRFEMLMVFPPHQMRQQRYVWTRYLLALLVLLVVPSSATSEGRNYPTPGRLNLLCSCVSSGHNIVEWHHIIDVPTSGLSIDLDETCKFSRDHDSTAKAVCEASDQYIGKEYAFDPALADTLKFSETKPTVVDNPSTTKIAQQKASGQAEQDAPAVDDFKAYYLTQKLFISHEFQPSIKNEEAARRIRDQLNLNYPGYRYRDQRVDWNTANYSITSAPIGTIDYVEYVRRDSDPTLEGKPDLRSDPFWNCSNTEKTFNYERETFVKKASEITSVQERERTLTVEGAVSVKVGIADAKTSFTDVIRSKRSVTTSDTAENSERRTVKFEVTVPPNTFYKVATESKRETITTSVKALGVIDMPISVTYVPPKLKGFDWGIRPGTLPVGYWSDFAPVARRSFEARAEMSNLVETFTTTVSERSFDTPELCGTARLQHPEPQQLRWVNIMPTAVGSALRNK